MVCEGGLRQQGVAFAEDVPVHGEGEGKAAALGLCCQRGGQAEAK